MATLPRGYREVRIVVPGEVYNRLQDMKEDQPSRTVQSLLAPVVQAFTRGEIRQEFVQGPPPKR